MSRNSFNHCSMISWDDVLEEREGWILTFLSSLMCLIGCGIIYLDVIYSFLFPKLSKTHRFNIKSNGKFLIGSLSLSGGSLLFTSMSKLFPHAITYLQQHEYLLSHPRELQLVMLACLLSGIGIYGALSVVIHHFTAESIIHCAHDEENDVESGHQHSEESHAEPQRMDESTPLIVATHKHHGVVHKKSLNFKDLNSIGALEYLKRPFCKKSCKRSLVAYSPRDRKVADCAGCEPQDADEDNSIENLQIVTDAEAEDHDDHHEDHRHLNVATSVSRLFSIGLQTTLAISLHKFPEGFIYYATSKIDQGLSLNIFLSLAIHNIAEGFSMTLPLYLALNSRLKAILISGVLGSVSQPLGALLGWLVLPRDTNSIDQNQISLIFGCLMALTSGFLMIIGVQMVVSSVGFGGSQSFVVKWFFTGVLIICVTSTLTG